MIIYEFAAVWSDGVTSIIIVQPQLVLAKDEKAAMMLALRAIPGEYVKKMDQVQIALRAFPTVKP